MIDKLFVFLKCSVTLWRLQRSSGANLALHHLPNRSQSGSVGGKG